MLVQEGPLGRKRVFFSSVGSAGRIRGSAENNSRVILVRPASDPFLAGHDLTRPVSFDLFLTRPDPIRPVRFEKLLPQFDVTRAVRKSLDPT